MLAIDAYQQGLVKQIEVFSVIEEDSHNYPFIKLAKVSATKTKTSASVEVDIKLKNNISRTNKTVIKGDDFEDLTKREIYKGYIVDDIWTQKGEEYISFTNGEFIRLGHDNKNTDTDAQLADDNYIDSVKKSQIDRTIKTHLDRELDFIKRGLNIKILSLFFIDKVRNYRDYEREDKKGKYARYFEDKYTQTSKLPKYNKLFEKIDTDLEAERVHEGYFSSDKHGLKDTKGNTKADESTYDLIMKNKEALLSKYNPSIKGSEVKFIFSHSALKEGWDNPNVFQICTLNETKSEMKKRQEVGRGLRLCVDHDGNRIFDKNINILTIMVNQHYQDFVKALQHEIEEEGNIKFGILQDFDFAMIQFTNSDGNIESLGQDKSKEIFKHCKSLGYIDSKGKITDDLKSAIKNKTVEVPVSYIEYKEEITEVLKGLTRTLDIKNSRDTIVIKPKKEVLLSPEFKELWAKICHKTRYKVDFDNHDLINACAESIKQNVSIKKIKLNTAVAKVDITKAGIEAVEYLNDDITDSSFSEVRILPDILTNLQNSTGLKRASMADILKKSNRFADFKNNPQRFIDAVSKDINIVKQKFIVDGISYFKTNDKYDQSLYSSRIS